MSISYTMILLIFLISNVSSNTQWLKLPSSGIQVDFTDSILEIKYSKSEDKFVDNDAGVIRDIYTVSIAGIPISWYNKPIPNKPKIYLKSFPDQKCSRKGVSETAKNPNDLLNGSGSFGKDLLVQNYESTACERSGEQIWAFQIFDDKYLQLWCNDEIVIQVYIESCIKTELNNAVVEFIGGEGEYRKPWGRNDLAKSILLEARSIIILPPKVFIVEFLSRPYFESLNKMGESNIRITLTGQESDPTPLYINLDIYWDEWTTTAERVHEDSLQILPKKMLRLPRIRGQSTQRCIGQTVTLRLTLTISEIHVYCNSGPDNIEIFSLEYDDELAAKYGITTFKTIEVTFNVIDSPTLYTRFVGTECEAANSNTEKYDFATSTLISVGKPTSSSMQASTGRASSVVDGDKLGVVDATKGKYCSRELFDSDATTGNHLTIHLLGLYVVTDVVIYQVDKLSDCSVYREKILKGVTVTVDGEQCGTAISDVSATYNSIRMECKGPMKGSVVNISNTEHLKSIRICEVEVYGNPVDPDLISQKLVNFYPASKLLPVIKGTKELFKCNLTSVDIESLINIGYFNMSLFNITSGSNRILEHNSCSGGKQILYRGTVSTTKKGHTCQKWSSQEPKKHDFKPELYSGDGIGDHNFCRNPGGNKESVWCYVEDAGDIEWDYCHVPVCVCWNGDQASYYGNIAASETGKPCETWTDHSYTESHNYCRNPRIKDVTNKERAWCFTGTKTSEWEYCSVPVCTGDSSIVYDNLPDTNPRAHSNVSLSLSFSLEDLEFGTKFQCSYTINDSPAKHNVLDVVLFIETDFKPVVEKDGLSCIHYARDLPEFNTKIYRCPNSSSLYTKETKYGACIFSQKCKHDEQLYQACGCQNVALTSAESTDTQQLLLETAVCLNQQNNYEAVWKGLLCDEIEHCKNNEDEATCDTATVTEEIIDKNNHFGCLDGTYIEKTLKCNGKPDCTGTMIYAKELQDMVLLYEDETGCRHRDGFECTVMYNGNSVLAWVHPKYQCDGHKLCIDGKDEPEDCKAIEENNEFAFNCTKTTKNWLGKEITREVSVYKYQLCDYKTGYYYCDDWWLTYYNCTYKPERSQMDTEMIIYEGINCTVNGGNTIIPKDVECDGTVQCDDDRDEQCIRATPSCSFNIENIDDTTTTICDGNYHPEQRMRCPGNSTYNLLIDSLCDNYDNCGPGNKSEENACPSSQMVVANSTQRANNSLFMPRCLPGLAKEGDCEMLELEKEVGVKRKVAVEKDKSYPCKYVGGEMLVWLECLNRCENVSKVCRYKPTTTCNDAHTDIQTTVLSLSVKDKAIVKVFENRSGDESFYDAKHICTNGRCIPVSQICDHDNNCGDWSDEHNCQNQFKCTDTDSFIPNYQTCDGKYHCQNKRDECSEVCKATTNGRFMILNGLGYKVGALAIGILAIIINLISLVFYVKDIPSTDTISAFINNSFVALIALGDLAVGAYMLLLFIYDLKHLNNYCEHRLEWLSSSTCSFFGVLSTFGTQVSLLSMTCLSFFRIYSLKTMMIFADFSAGNILKFVAVVVFILGWSILTSIPPVLGIFEDYFVNGLYYPNNTLFLDTATRQDLYDVLSKWHFYTNDSHSVLQQINMTPDEPWHFWRERVKELFERDTVLTRYSSYKSADIGFYGNDGVCLFKYFVTPSDPQYIFSMALLAQNLLCFVIITVCYSMIILHTLQTSQSSGVASRGNSNMQKLQRKVSVIIATDFLTWIPFITLSLLHFGDAIDASAFYTASSIVLIPINSVLNPLIYNGDTLFLSIMKRFSKTRKARRGTKEGTTVSNTVVTQAQPDTEMKDIEK